MARLGFIVLSTDPIGQGERSAESHHHLEALLVGLSQPGIAEYETQCALEYLRLRKEVDAARIGMTGVDGGGFNTWITAALDDRIVAAVPVDDTFDFFAQVHRMRAVDWNQAEDQCQLVPGILQYANMQELVAMIAPRALLMIAGPDTHDIFEYGQRVYATFERADRIGQFESDGGGYQKHGREAAYEFFLHVLMNRGRGLSKAEQQTNVVPFDSPELACLPKGYQAPAGPGIAETVRRLANTAPSARSGLSVETLAGQPPERGVPEMVVNSFPVQRENIGTEKNMEVPVTILRPGPSPHPGGGGAGTLLAIDDRDKETLASDPVVQEAFQRDWLVVEVDPRGFGELTVQEPGWVFATSLLLGENFVWRQAWDVHFLLDTMEHSASHRVALYARGPNASLAAAYAIWMNRSDYNVAWAILRGGFTSLRQFLDPPAALKPANHGQSIPFEYFAFAAIRSLDIPQLLSGTKCKTFLIDPVDRRSARAAESEGVRLMSVERFVNAGW